MDAPILSISGLRAVFRIAGRDIAAVQDLDLVIGSGETVALVGESGSGKSVTSLSIIGLLPKKIGHIAEGSIALRRRDRTVAELTGLDPESLRKVRGNDIGMVFQEPMTSLNPVYTIGEQIAEPIRNHLGKSHRDAAADAVRLLAQVGIPDPRRAQQYPHELSGGMRQRATIAMALSCDPTLLIADEPTTALDVTIQAQILDLLAELQAQRGMGILFVTHNLGVVAEIADRVAVMYAGRIVESGPVSEVFTRPRHPYTAGLMRSVPRLGQATTLKAAGTPLPTIAGNVPSLALLPKGCSFAPRCALAIDACRTAVPPLFAATSTQQSRCLRWEDL
ncbi:MAG: ABC transporter ATP-binding protein [Mesorhizobium sp.]|uniref:ABC transporter ATP-binding protein n=1 Tax=Mesorhizobium sp. TaxID=1871066 RepID=UPI000FE884BE|nr:ABC transporter ATP-binding protein [Mesorhizobium sp.]RWB34396.1 MAG: ABC transporter ATP-binding protein [Mesorhizobium sp.]RWB80541.1 MAG: ABC transporter ATP-binding protein [Mesorhizobium sp.]